MTEADLKKLLDFGKKSLNASRQLKSDVNDIKKRTAFAAFTGAMNATRVDTSKAISNWKISVNAKNEIQRPAYFLGEGGSTKWYSYRLAQRIEYSNLQTANPGDVIYVSNHLDYVSEYLNPADSIVGKSLSQAYYVANASLKLLKNSPTYFR